MLSSLHRLPSPEIAYVMKHGKRIQGNGFSFLFIQRGTSQRFAFIVSVKVDKRATHRNRIKRLMSESVRRLLPRLSGPVDAVMIGMRGLDGLKQKDVDSRVIDAFRQGDLH